MLVISDPTDGHGFEQEFCGCDFTGMGRQLRHRAHNFEEGVRRVKARQYLFDNWDPRKPRTPLSQCLYRRVASRLKRGEELRLFIAINTVLDFRMGIDCFFEYDHRIATIDLTVSTFKKYFRAHFLLRRLDFLRNEHYRIGDLIAQKLS